MIDFFVVCDKTLPLLTSMTIDKQGQHSLTKYKGGVVKTDRNILDMEVDLVFHKKKKHERLTLFIEKNNSCRNFF